MSDSATFPSRSSRLYRRRLDDEADSRGPAVRFPWCCWHADCVSFGHNHRTEPKEKTMFRLPVWCVIFLAGLLPVAHAAGQPRVYIEESRSWTLNGWSPFTGLLGRSVEETARASGNRRRRSEPYPQGWGTQFVPSSIAGQAMRAKRTGLELLEACDPPMRVGLGSPAAIPIQQNGSGLSALVNVFRIRDARESERPAAQAALRDGCRRRSGPCARTTS
jgi:hypothetical protein